MTLDCFAIYDSKIKEYTTPFFAQNPDTAIRHIQRALSNPQSDLAMFPEDYTLFQLGAVDLTTGECISLSAPSAIRQVIALKEIQS